MSGSDRGDNTKAGLIWGIIAAALFAVAFIGWGLWKTAEYEREASNQAREYTAYTDEKIRKACLGLPPVNQKDCVAEARHEQRAYERDENDLVAQRKSALWAYIMGAAAVIGMGLSVIGVILVWTTFDATRKANAIANAALDGQLRPWMDFTIALTGLMYKKGELGMSIYAKFKHHGLSPALRFSSVAQIIPEHWTSERVYNFMPSFFDGDSLKEITVFPQAEWSDGINVPPIGIPSKNAFAVLVVAARYRSPYSDRFRYTCQIYDLHQPGRADGSIILDENTRLRVDIRRRDEMGDHAN